MFYINQIMNGIKETVDEFKTRKEAREMLAEYQMAFGNIRLWISTRKCSNWD